MTELILKIYDLALPVIYVSVFGYIAYRAAIHYGWDTMIKDLISKKSKPKVKDMMYERYKAIVNIRQLLTDFSKEETIAILNEVLTTKGMKTEFLEAMKK